MDPVGEMVVESRKLFFNDDLGRLQHRFRNSECKGGDDEELMRKRHGRNDTQTMIQQRTGDTKEFRYTGKAMREKIRESRGNQGHRDRDSKIHHTVMV